MLPITDQGHITERKKNPTVIHSTTVCISRTTAKKSSMGDCNVAVFSKLTSEKLYFVVILYVNISLVN